MSTNQIPFETNDDGQYRITAPGVTVEGAIPDAIAVTIGKRTYRLTGYVGKAYNSRVNPDVLLYENCGIVTEPITQ